MHKEKHKTSFVTQNRNKSALRIGGGGGGGRGGAKFVPIHVLPNKDRKKKIPPKRSDKTTR